MSGPSQGKNTSKARHGVEVVAAYFMHSSLGSGPVRTCMAVMGCVRMGSAFLSAETGQPFTCNLKSKLSDFIFYNLRLSLGTGFELASSDQ